MQIIINVGDATPQDWEALAAFVAVKRGLLSTTGRIEAPVVSGPAAFAVPEPVAPPPPVAAALAKADGIASTISAMVDDMTAKANAKATADHEAFLARQAAADNGYTPVTPPPGVEVDKDGLPWDARIHAESKAKNADGSWRAKRKVDPAVVTAVTAELRAVMSAPVPAVAPPPPPPSNDVQAEAAARFGTPAPLPPSAAVPPPPPPAATPAVPPAPVAASVPPASPLAAGAETVAEAPPAPATGDPPFVVMMRGVTARQAAGTLTADAVAAALANLGLPSIASLASRPDLIPSFEALLQ